MSTKILDDDGYTVQRAAFVCRHPVPVGRVGERLAAKYLGHRTECCFAVCNGLQATLDDGDTRRAAPTQVGREFVCGGRHGSGGHGSQ